MTLTEQLFENACGPQSALLTGIDVRTDFTFQKMVDFKPSNNIQSHARLLSVSP